jgi:hypothetical protein
MSGGNVGYCIGELCGGLMGVDGMEKSGLPSKFRWSSI